MSEHVNFCGGREKLPFYGKVKVGKRSGRVIWGPAVFWNEAPPDEQARYFAWINGATWEVPDPLECPYWPWWPIEPTEWHELHRAMEGRRSAQES